MQKKSTSQFIQTLQSHAKKQSRLQDNFLLPHFLYPVTTFVGENPWQSLLLSSFVVAWIIFLLWFEFFFNFVQNML